MHIRSASVERPLKMFLFTLLLGFPIRYSLAEYEATGAYYLFFYVGQQSASNASNVKRGFTKLNQVTINGIISALLLVLQEILIIILLYIIKVCIINTMFSFILARSKYYQPAS